MRNPNKLLLFSVFILEVIIISACTGRKTRDLHVNLKGVEIEPIKIKRYEKALFNIPPEVLKPELKKISTVYPVFLDYDLDDTLIIIQLHRFITEPVNRELYQFTTDRYPELNFLENDFQLAFRYFKYYYPDKPLPNITTYVSGLLYELPIQFFGNEMVIALDMYLGDDVEYYRRFRFPLYKIERMNSDYIVRDGIYDFYYLHFLKKPGSNMLEKMISNGKHLYFVDAMLPDVPDYIKIGYPPEKLEWCIANESNIWAFIIQNELLYSGEAGTLRKFFADGPFTNQFGQQSPARVGEWIGWLIVRSYMNKNREISLNELLDNDDFQMIFNNSGYRPAK